MKPIEAYSYYIYEDLDELAIIELANFWLENNIVTDSFCKLCYVDTTNTEEILKLFEAGLLELNIIAPTTIEAGLVIIRRILSHIILQKIDAMQGMSYINKNLHDRMSKALENNSTGFSCFGPIHDSSEKSFKEEGSGINFNLVQLFGWEREIKDCVSGSYLNFYSDIPRDLAELKMYKHLIEESKKWLQWDELHNKK